MVGLDNEEAVEVVDGVIFVPKEVEPSPVALSSIFKVSTKTLSMTVILTRSRSVLM